MRSIKGFLFLLAAGNAAAQNDNLAARATADFLHVRSSGRTAVVSGLNLTRDVGRFELTEGKLYVGTPVGQRTCAALFLGKGRLRMRPSTPFEVRQLERLLEVSEVDQSFTSLFLIFTDSTMDELSRHLRFENAEIPSDVDDYFHSYGSYFADNDRECVSSFDDGMMYALLNPGISYFMAGLSTRSPSGLAGSGMFSQRWADDPLFFSIDPRGHDLEEVRLLRRNAAAKSRYWKEVISQFPQLPDTTVPSFLSLKKPTHYAVSQYRIDCAFDSKLRVRVSAEMRVTPLLPELHWIYMTLHHRLTVDSVYVNGRSVAFHKPAETSALFDDSFERQTLWIETDPDFRRQLPSTIRVVYGGEVITRIENDIYLESTITWYPNAGTRTNSTFDLTFHVPEQFTIASVGEKVAESITRHIRTSHWVLSAPSHNAGFAVGFYRQTSIRDSRIPPITVLVDVHKQGICLGSKIEDQVLADIANSYAYFQEWFGPISRKSLMAAEIAYSHGESFPGLIHLGWRTFTDRDAYGFDELFRAHEVAHQWWPGDDGYATYHDQWLGEGFAEYFGLMYMQHYRQNNDDFFRFLKEYREDLLRARKGLSEKLFGEDVVPGPIWLGHRNANSATTGDVGVVVYEKGAWVLHMLRMMMIDLNMMKEDRFRAMMRDFSESGRAGGLRTQNFQRIVDKHFSQDMSWFFDQWVYGCEIPKYEVSHRILPQKNGRFKIRFRIRPSGVPSAFHMPFPVLIDYGQKKSSRFRLLATGEPTEVETPELPLEPKEIVYNYLESVLCDLKETSW